ncbi:MAG: hypothetical protein COB41_00110 [Proteobacteria bacterium]|nr:MAG: hypothetical protein COB41_00110 [Pseudomonadota bacterium]
MCKVFGVAGINDSNRGDVIRISKAVGKKMVTFEKDGFGYCAINSKGELHGEKWLKPEHVFNKRIRRKMKTAREVIPRLDKPVLENFGNVITGYQPIIQQPAPPVYDDFGEGALGDSVAIIMHSRHSTGAAKTVKNVHPFVNYNTALVHNGIVYNEDDAVFYKTVSDCDSEILLNQYNSEMVQMDSRRLAAALAPVEAYFACLVLTEGMDQNEKMYPIMDIFKADADLEIVYIHDLEVYTFCTKGSIVVDVCKDIGYSTSRPMKIADNVLIRIDAVTGKIAEEMPFEYKGGHSYYGASYGYNNDTYLKSRHGEDWENYTDKYENNGVPHYREDHNDNDPDEPNYRKSAKESADAFKELTSDPLDNGSTFSSDDINKVLLSQEEKESVDLTIEEIMEKHRDKTKGGRHA